MLRESLSYFEPAAIKLKQPVSDNQIAEVEKTLGTEIPRDLRDFLSMHDGIDVAGIPIFGCSQIVRNTLEDREADPEGWNPGHLQVSEDGLGNPFYLDTTESRV